MGYDSSLWVHCNNSVTETYIHTALDLGWVVTETYAHTALDLGWTVTETYIHTALDLGWAITECKSL
jgi:hypothetical protein